MSEQHKYNVKELEVLFPKMNFSFVLKSIVPQLLTLLNGRVVGGIVRDSLLGRSTNDLDIATPYLPNKAKEILIQAGFHPIDTGISYGTISLFLQEMKVEITSLRKDVKNFGRRAEVEFGGTWEEDSLRRDFTFNGLFLSIEENIYVYDYHNGIEDLQNGIVRFIGNYRDRIGEDYLRILRFIRFFIRYSTNLDYVNYIDNTMKDLENLVKDMGLLSMERVLMEIQLILVAENWKLGIEIVNQLGISKLFFREILFIPSFSLPVYQQYTSEKIRLIYTLSYLSPQLIENLPIQKEMRNLILMYIRFITDPSIDNIFYIWNKIKTLTIVNFIIKLWQASLLDIRDYKYHSHITDEAFEEMRKNRPLVHKTGPDRGIEEKNIRMEFIGTKISI